MQDIDRIPQFPYIQMFWSDSYLHIVDKLSGEMCLAASTRNPLNPKDNN